MHRPSLKTVTSFTVVITFAPRSKHLNLINFCSAKQKKYKTLSHAPTFDYGQHSGHCKSHTHTHTQTQTHENYFSDWKLFDIHFSLFMYVFFSSEELSLEAWFYQSNTNSVNGYILHGVDVSGQTDYFSLSGHCRLGSSQVLSRREKIWP